MFGVCRVGLPPMTVMFVSMVLCACESSPIPESVKICNSDTDCQGENQICSNGACRFACLTDEDCKDSEKCVSGGCLFVCTQDADCLVGEECQNGHCQPKEPDPPDGGSDAGPVCDDQDHDGYGEHCALGSDCDDTDPQIFPGALERCADGKDNDCDQEVDEADCGCRFGDRIACYTGDPANQAVGICHAGVAMCGQDKTFGPCQGEKLPETEVCDGLDNNCDGEVDEGLLNACGQCEAQQSPLVELCSNGIDDDCDGQVDEGCDCDPGCQCDQGQAGEQCVCHPPTNQPCYTGPPYTLGFGPCSGGTHDCELQADGSYAWSECSPQVLPQPECPDGVVGVDDDCDGLTDEGCQADADGDTFAPPEDCDDSDDQIHPGAVEVCNDRDDDCDGVMDEGVTNACGVCGEVPEEVCGDGLDNDCDNKVDEGCGGCTGDGSRACYTGPPGTEGIGICAYGSQVCDGEFWETCKNDVLPGIEICDGLDNDCDGEVDEQWAVGSNACGYCESLEICDTVDNDCDGFTDEGLVNACGQCLPVAQESVCDGKDDDCDGSDRRESAQRLWNVWRVVLRARLGR